MSVPNNTAHFSVHCPVCEATEGRLHLAHEMMFGMGGTFRYLECCLCGCLSLLEIPPDLSAYYPLGTYYSLRNRRRNVLRDLRARIYMSPLSFLVRWRRLADLDVVKKAGLTKRSRLLDVGCGAGNLVADLRELGYAAEGIDPFVEGDITDRFGVRVQRKTLSDVTSKYDFILFRHSLEHMSGHRRILQAAYERLSLDGMCIVCMPVASWAWKTYGTSWSQLDAPRHLIIHTLKSFGILAESSGFEIERTVFDSNEFQFWASEVYSHNVPLARARVPGWIARVRLRRRARMLNHQGNGDSAIFYLRRVDHRLSAAAKVIKDT
jgi:SAM-dependent methyltransferase